MKEPLISVIISVYNTEQYISKCLDSILNQTYKNLEIIVINDCSKDKSYEILKKYAKNNSNIKLLNNEVNKGLSYSRNIGLDHSNGEYIGYIDSDDYIDDTYYEKLVKAILKEKSPSCGSKYIYDGSFSRNLIPGEGITTKLLKENGIEVVSDEEY